MIVSCTASTLPIIGLGAVESALKQRRRKPMFLVDLAVPRDIEPEVARLSDVYLYTVDDLSMLVQSGGEKRQAAVAQAEAIVDAGVRGFAHWLEQRHNVPLIREVNARADAWRDAALARARKQLARGENMDAVLESLARGLTAKVLHGTLSELRQTDSTHRERGATRPCRGCSCAAARAPRRPDSASRASIRALRPRGWLHATLPLGWHMPAPALDTEGPLSSGRRPPPRWPSARGRPSTWPRPKTPPAARAPCRACPAWLRPGWP